MLDNSDALASARPARRPWLIGVVVGLIVIIAVVVLAVVRPWQTGVASGQTRTFVVPSGAMENTLMVGDMIAVTDDAKFQRGDIVVFSDPGGWLAAPAPTDQQYLIKRVIGLPGDRVVCCSDGHLTINGTPIDESSYLEAPTNPASAFQFDVTVPAGRLFMLGDNRDSSADSRWHLCEFSADGLGMNGFVPFQNVLGRVRAVVSPPENARSLATPTSVFAQVPSGVDPPAAAKVIVGVGGPAGVCHN